MQTSWRELTSVQSTVLLTDSDFYCTFSFQAFKDMLYAAQDQAPSVEGKKTPCLDKQTQTPRHADGCTRTQRRTRLYPVPLALGLFGHPQNNSPSSAKNRQKSLLMCCHSLHKLWLNHTKANYQIITFHITGLTCNPAWSNGQHIWGRACRRVKLKFAEVGRLLCCMFAVVKKLFCTRLNCLDEIKSYLIRAEIHWPAVLRVAIQSAKIRKATGYN